MMIRRQAIAMTGRIAVRFVRVDTGDDDDALWFDGF